VGVGVIVGVWDELGVAVLVEVLVSEAVPVEVKLAVGVNVSVKVEVKVKVAEGEGVTVVVFSTGWKGVRVAGREKGVRVGETDVALIGGVKGRKGASSAGRTQSVSRKQPAIKVKNNRTFIGNLLRHA